MYMVWFFLSSNFSNCLELSHFCVWNWSSACIVVPLPFDIQRYSSPPLISKQKKQNFRFWSIYAFRTQKLSTKKVPPFLTTKTCTVPPCFLKELLAHLFFFWREGNKSMFGFWNFNLFGLSTLQIKVCLDALDLNLLASSHFKQKYVWMVWI